MSNLFDQNTKCLLIYARFHDFSFWNHREVLQITGAEYLCPPLGLMTVAALLPRNWEIRLVDENIEELKEENFQWADLICTGGMISQHERMSELIKLAHKHQRPIAVGGTDPSMRPEFYEDADYLVLGEGEVAIPDFLADLAAGKKQGRYTADRFIDLKQTPVPRFDLMKNPELYLYKNLQFSRGCPYECEFCDISKLCGRKVRFKSPDQIISELQILYDMGCRKEILFVDDNFTGSRKQVKILLNHLIKWSAEKKYPFIFAFQASIDIADDLELLELLRKLNFRYSFIGIESPSQAVLQGTAKTPNLQRDLVADVRTINSFGINVDAGLILGFDNEGNDIRQKMLEFIHNSGAVTCLLGLLYALPHTILGERLMAEGRLFRDDVLQTANNIFIDQTINGLNFLTTRPRKKILEDFIFLIKEINSPAGFFGRIIKSHLIMHPENNFRPNFRIMKRDVRSFFIVCAKLGFKKSTSFYFWKIVFLILFKNPKAFDRAISMAAMFPHFAKQTEFVAKNMQKEIDFLEEHGEDYYNRLRKPIKQQD